MATKNVDIRKRRGRRAFAAGSVLALAGMLSTFASGVLGAQDDPCTPAGGLQFICGLAAPPEDLVAVPGTPFLIASGTRLGHALHLVNAERKTVTEVGVRVPATP